MEFNKTGDLSVEISAFTESFDHPISWAQIDFDLETDPIIHATEPFLFSGDFISADAFAYEQFEGTLSDAVSTAKGMLNLLRDRFGDVADLLGAGMQEFSMRLVAFDDDTGEDVVFLYVNYDKYGNRHLVGTYTDDSENEIYIDEVN